MLAGRAARLLAPTHARLASSIALKYSQAAYGAALSKSPATLNKVQTDLNTVSSTLASTPALAEFVSNPTLSANDRSEGLKQLFAAAEKTAKLDEITKNLFAVLSENGRLSETAGVIEGFQELVAKYKGELDVIVTSAEPLPKDVLANLERSLKQSEAGKAAKVLKLTNKVNPAILGGLIVDLGEKTIDLSVSNRVNKLNGLLQESV
ncbi:ATP synthase subunit 5 [Auricularia subglabra TFB-10046 SS5]|uniref:ATP synthase subunit 5, mitochondrial n=1 Tax=Auricularia subglabra (strain TFB-10046 / SS5) TaxID=717982 RepID=J0LF26_AURST|nr:ATP synthase subunit 5 [Auricularia subglabra TFB-10046 SS5]